jgi:hypothetical protein
MREKANNPVDSLVAVRLRLLRRRRKMSHPPRLMKEYAFLHSYPAALLPARP